MLESFLIGWVLFTIVMGSFFGVIVFFRVEGVKGFFLGLLTAILLGALTSGVFTLDSIIKQERWNDGMCPNCEIEWTPNGVSSSHLGEKTYHYYCEECKKMIEI